MISRQTLLSAVVVDNLQKTLNGRNKTTLCLYVQNPEHLEQVTLTPQHLSGSLLKQFMQYNPTRPISKGIREVYKVRQRARITV